MPVRVSIADEQSSLVIDRARTRDVVRKTLRSEGITDATISVAFVDDPTMHDLNRQHLQHDYPTDVLSFLLAGGPEFNDQPSPSGLDGEIIVSTDTAIRQAAEYKWSPQDELTLYLVHGLLHLCGLDDHTPADRRLMRARERDVLQFWDLTPHYET
ncbi:MAG: rRNA maturation RNase YbeY [Planctomycetaceae bacterium]|nr:rRNA maturation RNase YbeY [Planctomycetaceae bacterium]